ncbi:AMP-binding protein [Desulfosarcina cetonica]|uniref:AMP-binding protein n=1 Tax=Desulfosarcina cetonica TaxID=90730 RepID=UPI0030EC5B92
MHAYGATETTPLVTTNLLKPSIAEWPQADRWELRKKQGLPLCGLDIKIMDPREMKCRRMAYPSVKSLFAAHGSPDPTTMTPEARTHSWMDTGVAATSVTLTKTAT